MYSNKSDLKTLESSCKFLSLLLTIETLRNLSFENMGKIPLTAPPAPIIKAFASFVLESPWRFRSLKSPTPSVLSARKLSLEKQSVFTAFALKALLEMVHLFSIESSYASCLRGTVMLQPEKFFLINSFIELPSDPLTTFIFSYSNYFIF